jgi:hypothetical protein
LAPQQKDITLISAEPSGEGIIIYFSDGTITLFQTHFLYEVRDQDGNVALTDLSEEDLMKGLMKDPPKVPTKHEGRHVFVNARLRSVLSMPAVMPHRSRCSNRMHGLPIDMSELETLRRSGRVEYFPKFVRHFLIPGIGCRVVDCRGQN